MQRTARRRQEQGFGRRLVKPICECQGGNPGSQLREMRDYTHCRDLAELA